MDRMTEVSRRLAVLPAAAGGLAVLALIGGGLLAAVTETAAGRGLTVAAGSLVAIAVVSGFVVGHYLGLALFVCAALMAVEPRSTTQLVVIVVALVLSHQLGRFSLDARRPTRFAPGFVRSFAVRSTLIAVVAGSFGVVAAPVSDLDLPPVLVSVGLALAALPLYTRRAVQAMSNTLRTSSRARLAIGLAATILALTGALLGAQARTGLVNERTIGGDQTKVDPTSTAGAESDRVEPDELDDRIVERVISFVLLTIAILVAGLLYAAFRRPEIGFELDELDMDADERSIGLANPGDAELDDYAATIEEQDISDLLDGLLLDITSEPDPGRAIRFGYATVERRLSELGIERCDSETEQELLTRALPVLPSAQSSLIRLTELFESARFGTDEMSEITRSEAVEAVLALRAAVGSGAAVRGRSGPS